MVRAARQIDGNAIGQRSLARGDRGARRPATALHHFRRPRKADLALARRVKPTGAHRIHIFGRVRQQQRVVVGARRLGHGQARHVGQDPRPQVAVLAHRKPMTRRQRQYKVVGVERPHVNNKLQRNKNGTRAHPNLGCTRVFFETELRPKVVNGTPSAPRARIFLPQKITPNGWSRNSCARKIDEF